MPAFVVLPVGDGRSPVAEHGAACAGVRSFGRDGEDLAHGRGQRVGHGASAVGHREAEAAEVVVLVVVAVPAAVVLHQLEREHRARRGLRPASRATNTALRGTLLRPGPTSMLQAVWSLPSMAYSIGPVTRGVARLVVEDRRRAAARAG